MAAAMEVGTGTAKKTAGSRAVERNSSAIRFAIETICESTGVSAELASYALLVSKVGGEIYCCARSNPVHCRGTSLGPKGRGRAGARF